MTHSANLQDVTHGDIIRIGTHYEEQLRETLHAEAAKQTTQELEKLSSSHAIELTEAAQERQKQRVEFDVELREQESKFEERLLVEKEKWLDDIQLVIEAEREKTREIERAHAQEQLTACEARAQGAREQQAAEHEVDKCAALEAQTALHQARVVDVERALAKKLEGAHEDIAHLGEDMKRREEHFVKVMEDMKISYHEKYKEEIADTVKQFEAEKCAMSEQTAALESTIVALRKELADAHAALAGRANQHAELKEEFKKFVLRNRPELIDGQIDFMFEF